MAERTLPLRPGAAQADEREQIRALGQLAAHLLTVPELPPDAPREQLFEFAALAGLAATYGPDLLRDPEPFNRVARAYLGRRHPRRA